jgi:hypothetical protein
MTMTVKTTTTVTTQGLEMWSLVYVSFFFSFTILTSIADISASFGNQNGTTGLLNGPSLALHVFVSPFMSSHSFVSYKL